MNAKRAKQVICGRRPSGADDESHDMKAAVAFAEGDAALKESFTAQKAFDAEFSSSLKSELTIPEESDKELKSLAEKLADHAHAPRHTLTRQAMAAVGIGFILVIGTLVWHLLGRAGAFPDDAVEIATLGMKSPPELFEAVDVPAGELSDWFVLKGFDHFVVPAELEKLKAVGVRIFTTQNNSVAMALVPEHNLCFFAFNADAFGVSVVPEKTWAYKEVNGSSLAVRQEGASCFMVWSRGKRADLQKLIEGYKAGK